jgi:hypothetical protein
MVPDKCEYRNNLLGIHRVLMDIPEEIVRMRGGFSAGESVMKISAEDAEVFPKAQKKLPPRFLRSPFQECVRLFPNCSLYLS